MLQSIVTRCGADDVPESLDSSHVQCNLFTSATPMLLQTNSIFLGLTWLQCRYISEYTGYIVVTSSAVAYIYIYAVYFDKCLSSVCGMCLSSPGLWVYKCKVTHKVFSTDIDQSLSQMFSKLKFK